VGPENEKTLRDFRWMYVKKYDCMLKMEKSKKYFEKNKF
jgi:hypothetical protein